MPDDAHLPNLTFKDIKYGKKETPWDLGILLYRGGASANSKLVVKLIADGKLGKPQLDRLALVVKLHEKINGSVSEGGSRETAKTQIVHLRLFFGWADRKNLTLDLDAVTETYCAWADSLVYRTRINPGSRSSQERPIGMPSAYVYGASVGMILGDVLDRHSRIIELTRLYMPSHRKTASGIRAEKQNLEQTFIFGHVLQDICDQLTIEVTCATPLPVRINFWNGKHFYAGGGTHITSVMEHGVALGDRYPIANLRIESELLMFIGQTGMNLAQAQNLELRQFFYVSHLDGFQVKDYKARRGGTVLFEVFKDYRPHFERYLAWRTNFFKHSSRLFPFVRFRGSRHESRCGGQRLRVICAELGMVFVGPQFLRNTRVNWILRKTADPDLTADMAQHTKQTLHRVYERPSQQRAMVEVLRFWSKADPENAKTQAVAPGACTGGPKAVAELPTEAPSPDCVKASGCLWCRDHRDIDSMDHVWALSSFKHLKVIELSKVRSPNRGNVVPPARRAIDRLNEKLRWFHQSNETRRGWVAETEARVEEGDYHPDWHGVISRLEGAA